MPAYLCIVVASVMGGSVCYRSLSSGEVGTLCRAPVPLCSPAAVTQEALCLSLAVFVFVFVIDISVCARASSSSCLLSLGKLVPLTGNLTIV